MKSYFLVILSLLLATAILAPAVITLIDIDEKRALVIDFNEEENKKEESKEVSEKDFFYSLKFMPFSEKNVVKSKVSRFYFEGDYHHSMDIFLPPPEHNS